MINKLRGNFTRVFFYVCVYLCMRCITACGPGAGVNHYSNAKLSVLQRKPDLLETSIHASGEYNGPLPQDDERLKPVITTEIVFSSYDLKSETRKAIQPCREALLLLAEEVKLHWKKLFRLKVTHGYTSYKRSAGRHRLHMEGRAFDFTLIPAPQKGVLPQKNSPVSMHNLQRLAGLAYYRTGFTFVEVRKTHVHASCRKDSTPTPDRSRCFPGNAFVRDELNKKILMKDLKIGTKVLTIGSDGKTFYTDVIMMMHKQTNQMISDYITLTTTSGQEITLSSHHLLYTLNETFIFSKDVKVNQSVYIYNSQSNSFNISRIVALDTVTMEGAYAPLSTEGTIVVNDVYVSCYALFPSHKISHQVFSLWRFLYHYLNWPSDFTTTSREYHWYPDLFRTAMNYLPIYSYEF